MLWPKLDMIVIEIIFQRQNGYLALGRNYNEANEIQKQPNGNTRIKANVFEKGTL